MRCQPKSTARREPNTRRRARSHSTAAPATNRNARPTCAATPHRSRHRPYLFRPRNARGSMSDHEHRAAHASLAPTRKPGTAAKQPSSTPPRPAPPTASRSPSRPAGQLQRIDSLPQRVRARVRTRDMRRDERLERFDTKKDTAPLIEQAPHRRVEIPPRRALSTTQQQPVQQPGDRPRPPWAGEHRQPREHRGREVLLPLRHRSFRASRSNPDTGQQSINVIRCCPLNPSPGSECPLGCDGTCL